MKKILIIFVSLLFISDMGAQQLKEVVYLSNGSIIKGEIIEQVPNVSIKLRTADGSIFVYPMSDVKKIAKEERVTHSVNNGKHRGLDFNINIGYNIGVGDFKKGKSLPIEIGLGKQFNKNLYLGLGSGVWLGTEKGVKPVIPISIDSKLMFPVSSSVIPIGIIRLGYMVNLSDGSKGGKQTVSTEYGNIDYDAPALEIPDQIMMQIMPGIQIPLSGKMDFIVAAGYTHCFFTKGNNSGGYFTVKAGINIHKSPNKKTKIPKEPVPTRYNGLQFTLEAGPNFVDRAGGTGDIICTYKLNPRISFGIGLGYEQLGGENVPVQTILVHSGRDIYSSYSHFEGSINDFKIYARGVYRFIDRRFSPLVACDAGIRFYSYLEEPYGKYITDFGDNILGDPDKNGLFVAPSIGLSLRTTNNSYLELKAGYCFANDLSGKKSSVDSFDEAAYASCKPIKTSAVFVTLGFTHTFKWCSRSRK